MKTKHILTALALPAMFAACTADDIESLNNGLQQDQRAKLSKDFVLNFSNDGVESRYAVEGTTGLNFVFEEGDKIGANLIDVYEKHPLAEAFDPKDPATWKIVKTVAPALPFIYQGGAWVSANEELGVGNYIFTNPFNPADKSRAAASYELPVIVNYSSENPNAHIEEYNKAVAAQVLREGETEANAGMKNIFAYPKIRINFDKSLDVKKVTKVILAKAYYDATNKKKVYGEFIYKGAFNHQAVVDIFNPKNLETYLKVNKTKTEADYWAQFQTSNFIIDEADVDVNGDGTDETTIAEVIAAAKDFADIKTTPYFIYEMNETVTSNSIDVRFIIPSIASLNPEVITNDERIYMYVCTDQGNFEMELTDLENYQFSETTLAAKKYAALQRNTSNTLKTIKLSSANESDDTFFTDNIVSTAADWNALVDKYGDLKKYSADYKTEQGLGEKSDAAELVVTILDDDFALTSDLKMPEVAEFVIKSEVGVEGAVTLKNIKMEGATLIVKKGATLTTDATLIAPTVEVEEGGNLVFAAVYNEDEELEAYTKVSTVNNHGTVTVPAGVEATFTLNNACKDAVLNVGAAASRAAEATEAVANLSGSNYGIINNYSVINATTLTNNAPVDKVGNVETGYEYDTEESEWNAVPTINNFGKFNAKGTVTNNGLFVNNAELSSNFTGDSYFYNTTVTDANYTATLDVKENAKTYIDANAGKIVLAKVNPTNFTIHNARKVEEYNNDSFGIIEYTMNKKDEKEISLKNSPVTRLITNVGIKLTNTYTYTDKDGKIQVCKLPELIVNGGEVEIAATTKNASNEDVPVALVGTMTINSGDVLVNGKINSVDEVKVMWDATLGIPASAELSVKNTSALTTGDEVEDAEAPVLKVNGILNLWDETGDDDGYLPANKKPAHVDLHKGVKITCKADTTDDYAAAKLLNSKREALQILVDAYLKNTPWIGKGGQKTWDEFGWTADIVWGYTNTQSALQNEAWVKAAETAFLTAWNAISSTDTDLTKATMWAALNTAEVKAIAGESISGVYDGYNADASNKVGDMPSCLKVAYTAATTETALKTSIKAALGNSWIGTSVYMKDYENQPVNEITGIMVAYKSAIEKMFTDADTEVEAAELAAKLGNVTYLSWKKFIEGRLNTTTFIYADEMAKDGGYIDESSYIEAYEGSTLYNYMLWWQELAKKYSSSVTGVVVFDAANISVANMAATFDAIYTAAQAETASVLFKNDEHVSQITEDVVKAAAALKYKETQLKGMDQIGDLVIS